MSQKAVHILQHQSCCFLQRRLSAYTTPDGLSDDFIKNNACFHKKCLNKYDKQKLKRKQVNNNTNKSGEVQKSKVTRQSMQARTFTDACFLCEGKGDLIHCRSLELDRKVQKMAEVLKDSKLLTKLAEGDVCATEAVYHKKCFTDCFNKYRKTKQSQSGVNISRNDIEGLALSAVIQWLKDSVASCIDDDKIPVYNQKDVVDMYQEQLRNHGANEDFISSVHCTCLIEKMLLSVPGIIATQTGQSTSSRVVLPLDGELGKALFQACDTFHCCWCICHSRCC